MSDIWKRLVFAAGLLISADAALAQDTRPLVVAHSEQCIVPLNGRAALGTPLVQQPCDGSPEQDWRFEEIGTGLYVRHIASNRCMHQQRRVQANEGAVTLWNCINAPNVILDPEPAPNGSVYLSFQHSRKCVGVFGFSFEPGARLIQYDCLDQMNEQFSLQSSNITSPVPTGPGTGPLVVAHSGKCIIPRGNDTDLDTALVQQACDGSPEQDWRFEAFGTGLHVRHIASNRCMHQSQALQTNGGVISLWDCVDAGNVVLDAVPEEGNDVTLRFQHSGLCANLARQSQADDAPLIQFTCSDVPHERFRPPSATGTDPSNGNGQWSAVMPMPLVPVAAASLPNGRVLTWSAFQRFGFNTSDNGQTFTAIFNPATGRSTEVLVSNTNHDMFCPGISMMPNGDYLVTGGSSASDVSIYDVSANRWTEENDMIVPRGYQSSATLSNGDVFTLGGSWNGGIGNKFGEVFSVQSQRWRGLQSVPADPLATDDSSGLYRADNHYMIFTTSEQDVFYAGPDNELAWIDTDGTDGTGRITFEGVRGTEDAMTGTAVMFDVDKILVAGGSNEQDKSSPGRTDSWIIDVSDGRGNVEVREVQNMAFARTLQNSVVLPSGEVVVIGGQAFSRYFSDDASVMVPEIFNPETETWTQHAPMQVPRNYHATAILLNDGRVFSGGGGLCGGCATNHANAEIFTPPYLVNEDGSLKTRPRITNAPATASYGNTIRVNADRGATAFVLMRFGSVTHTVNTDQRRVPVSTTRVNANTFAVDIPSNPGVLTPGNYFLFAMSADGVPSIARTINIQ